MSASCPYISATGGGELLDASVEGGSGDVEVAGYLGGWLSGFDELHRTADLAQRRGLGLEGGAVGDLCGAVWCGAADFPGHCQAPFLQAQKSILGILRDTASGGINHGVDDCRVDEPAAELVMVSVVPPALLGTLVDELPVGAAFDDEQFGISGATGATGATGEFVFDLIDDPGPLHRSLSDEVLSRS